MESLADHPVTDTDQTSTLSETQRIVREQVIAVFDSHRDPDLAWAIASLEKRMRRAEHENNGGWPIRSEEGLRAIENLLVAWTLVRAATRRLEFQAEGLAGASAEAKRQIRRHEGLRNDGWDVDPFGIVVLADDPVQNPQDVMEATLFLARSANDQQIEQAADGNLHPFVQERVGSLAPREYYRNLACLILEAGEAGRELISRVLEDEDFGKKMQPFCYLIALVTA